MDLLVGELLEVGEVEAEVLVAHIGALLLDVGAYDLAQGLVQQVGATVVVRDLLPADGIHPEGELAIAVGRDPVGDVYGKVVLLDGVEDLYLLSGSRNCDAGVAYLAAHLSVERSAVEYELEHLLVLLHHLAALEELRAGLLDGVVARELHVLALIVDGPVAEFVGGGVARAFLLLAEFHLEAVQVHLVALLAGNQFGEVDGEAEGVVEHEGVHSGDHLAGGVLGHIVVQELDAAVEGAQEGEFLFADDALDEFLLGLQFGIGVAHVVDELGNQPAEEGLAEAEEGVAVAHCAAKDAADDVARLHVGRKLTVGDAERDCADVVGADAHCDVGVLALAVFVAGEFTQFAKEAGEHVGVVVAVLALEHGAEALEAHSGVDVLGGQGFEMAVRLALELHEHQVPDLDDVRVALVHQVASGDAARALFLLAADVDVDLGAGAAGAGLSHLPEIVVLVAEQDALRGQVLEPCLAGLLVKDGAVFGAAFEHGRIEQLGIDAVDLGEQFPRPVDSLGLEVVAKTPVAQHLEHSVVVCIVSHFFEVVVLSAHAEALLAVGGAAHLRSAVAQEDVLELVHAGVGEHQRRVVFHNHGCGGDDGMSLCLKEVEKFLSYFLRSHHNNYRYLKYNPAKILLFWEKAFKIRRKAVSLICHSILCSV